MYEVSMASIAVLGEERNILGFKPYDVDVYLYFESEQSIEDWFKTIVKKEYKLILITETIAKKLQQQIDALWKKDFPVILTIGGLGVTGSWAFEHLRSLVIKAIGTDLFKES
jgi:vacuolar-type H+-ATPase subunit F/Vma7